MKVGHLEVDGEALAALCKKWKIAKLEVFGSVLRDDFGPNSDVDLLVTYEPDTKQSFDDLLDAVDEFSAVFGREVELVSRDLVAESENYIRRKAILRSAEVLYAA